MKRAAEVGELVDAFSGYIEQLVDEGRDMLQGIIDGGELEPSSLITSVGENSSWMLRFHAIFSTYLTGIDTFGYEEIGDDRGVFSFTLDRSMLEESDGKPKPLARAHDALYLRVATVLTLLVDARNRLTKDEPSRKERRINPQLLDAWVACAEAIPNVADDGYEEQQRQFNEAIQAWLRLTGMKEKHLVTKRNQLVPSLWVDHHGRTPEIHLREPSGLDDEMSLQDEGDEGLVGGCFPIRPVIIHNQLKKHLGFRFGRRLILTHGGRRLTYYSLAPLMKHEGDTAEERHQQVVEYYDDFCEQARIGRDKRVYVCDFRSNDIGRGKEGKSLEITKAALSGSRFHHINLPFVELRSGYGFPLPPEMSSDLRRVWEYPLWRMLRESVWNQPGVSERDRTEGIALLGHWLQCVNLMQSSVQTEDPEAYFYEQYCALVQTMHDAESAFLRQLAEMAVFSIDYHGHNERFDVSVERLFEKVRERIATAGLDDQHFRAREQRYSPLHRWRVGGIWGVVLGCVGVIAGVAAGFAVGHLIIGLIVALVVVPVMGAASGVCFWQSKKQNLPATPINRSPFVWSQYYAALTAPRLSAGALMSSVMSMLEQFDPKAEFLVFCQSSKDRTSVYLLLHGYHLACQEIAAALKQIQGVTPAARVSTRSRTPTEGLESKFDQAVQETTTLRRLGQAELLAKELIQKMSVLLKQVLMVYVGVQGSMKQPLATLFKYPVPEPTCDIAVGTLAGDPGVERYRRTVYGRFFQFYRYANKALRSKAAYERNKLYPRLK